MSLVLGKGGKRLRWVLTGPSSLSLVFATTLQHTAYMLRVSRDCPSLSLVVVPYRTAGVTIRHQVEVAKAGRRRRTKPDILGGEYRSFILASQARTSKIGANIVSRKRARPPTRSPTHARHAHGSCCKQRLVYAYTYMYSHESTEHIRYRCMHLV